MIIPSFLIRLLLLGALLGGCASQLGKKCAADSECSGLGCISNAPLLESNPDSGCQAAGIAISVCSKACTSSADCQGLSANPVCSTGCTGKGLCLNQGTASAGSPY